MPTSIISLQSLFRYITQPELRSFQNIAAPDQELTKTEIFFTSVSARFHAQSHFSRSFKRTFSLTPGQYHQHSSFVR
ncbi:MAG: hypothetical protein HC873_23300 [Leptolyngbyaceae cyanobacterium SL_1_1]|nr:hypothetical protein [Leptolyngbyaceae cyanobacterium SL_1_1]